MLFVEYFITLLIRLVVIVKLSLVPKLSKVRLKFIIVIFQVKLKLSKVCTLSKVQLELLVKLFQSRLDSSGIDHVGKIRENAKRENFKTSSERQVTKSNYF